MLTLKRYFNPVEASLHISLLQDYEIFCSPFDEHSHALGYCLVMPLRLMVSERQIHRAARILNYAEASSVPSDEVAAADDQAPVRVLDEAIFGEDEEPEQPSESIGRNNPWEILAIAYLFLVPGVGFLLEHLGLRLFVGGRRGNRYLVLSPLELHLIGASLICVALLLTVFYFYARIAIASTDNIDACAA